MTGTNERNSKIVLMRKNGHTFEEIAKIFGVSTERIRQICKKEENKKKANEMHDEFSELTTRTRNALLRAGIKDKEDLIKKLVKGFPVSNIGDKSIKEIEHFIHANINGTEFIKEWIYRDIYVKRRILKNAEVEQDVINEVEQAVLDES